MEETLNQNGNKQKLNNQSVLGSIQYRSYS